MSEHAEGPDSCHPRRKRRLASMRPRVGTRGRLVGGLVLRRGAACFNEAACRNTRKARLRRWCRRRSRSFNEAACRNTRKERSRLYVVADRIASMRPRVGTRGRDDTTVPRHLQRLASMRPRVGTRGRRVASPHPTPAQSASMRPRGGTRGRRAGRRRTTERARCFNEAACRNTRKVYDPRQPAVVARAASMRPRVGTRGRAKQLTYAGLGSPMLQ